MAVMNGVDRRLLVDTLEAWVVCARAGVQCTAGVTPRTIGLLETESDTAPTVGGAP